MKRIRVGDNWLLSTGGSGWSRYMNEYNSRLGQVDNTYLLNRARVYADVWYEDRFRIFAEGIFAYSMWQDLPKFITRLHKSGPRRFRVTTLALEFLILTATRSGETRSAAWSEIDQNSATWTIPPERMKAREEHRVPLSKRCLEILAELRTMFPRSELVFPSKGGLLLSDMTLTKLLRDEGLDATPHGFRSSFKVWASERAKVVRVLGFR